MTPTRKDFFKRLAYIALGLIPIFFVWEETGPKKFIGLAGFIFGMYHLILIIGELPQIIDDFFPPKTYSQVNQKPFDKFATRFAMIIFFAGLLFEVFEIKRIDNTIGGTRLFWTYALLGILLAIVLVIVLKFQSASIYFESRRRFTILSGMFLGLFLLAPATASFINHTFRSQETICNEYKIIRKATGGRRSKSSWIFIQINKSEERFDVTEEFWNSVNENGFVILCTQKGKLNYDVVSGFKTSDAHVTN